MGQPRRFPIVGVGASAGGVEALQKLLSAMPPEIGMALVVVTHLGPGRESELAGILAHCTSLPVRPAVDGEAVLPDHVYVLTHDAVLTMGDGRLRMQPQDPTRPRERQPIDVFFASLAEDQGERAVGIVLSGGGSDGSLGIKAIKEHGGLTIVQGTDGSEPRHPSMPDSAVATGSVDLVLPAEGIPQRLAELSHDLAVPDGEAGGSAGQAERAAICSILRGQVGHDFAGYKEKTFTRRVRRRMQVQRLSDTSAYVERLRRDPEEVVALFRDLLINVTGFFRDPQAFDALAGVVLPDLLESRSATDSVRIWVPGCATGEEAYSLAILALEQTEKLTNRPRVQIFATDIDEPALAVARAGRYPVQLLSGVAPERLEKFFVGDGTMYAVSKEVRDLCIFSAHSLIRDPPFSRIDLVSCRNLLIYLGAEVQDRVLPTFHYSLRPGGYLFLGSSENVTRHDNLFAPTDKAHRIFRRRDHAVVGLDRQIGPLLPGGSAWPRARHSSRPAREESPPNLGQVVETLVLEQFAPAYVVVDRDGDVILQSGRLGRYVEPPAGNPTHQLLAMARRGLRLELRAALREAMEQRRRVVRPRVEVEVDDRIQAVELSVVPLPGRDGADPLFVVLFHDIGAPVAAGETGAQGTSGEDGAMAQAERELREIRERLQSTIEEYETAVEELRSANEEMVSVNEELQSTNEELETAKEEQQSVNEEMQTVNLELAKKVQELDAANSDLRNLFESTRIATVFLDRNQLIRSFTPAVAGIFNLIPTDRGRPLTDFASHLDEVDLRQEVGAVLAACEPTERRVTSHGGACHYLMRLLPYRTAEGVVDGVLVTFVDVSNIVESEARLRTLVDELNHRVRNTLQVVTAVATNTLREASSPEAFTDGFLGRLRALGRAHELVSRSGWGDVQLVDLVMKELEPYADPPGRFSIVGKSINLKPKAALALGMSLHELPTNAVKHGALSVGGGRVNVAWAVEGNGAARNLVLRWHEEGGPKVSRPTRRSFGSVLMERQMRHDLKGTIELDYAEDGLHAILAFPINGAPSEQALPTSMVSGGQSRITSP